MINSFAAASNCSRHPGLTPQATIADNVPSAPVWTKVDIGRHILHTSEIYYIFHSNGLWETTHCGVLSKNYSAAKELTVTKQPDEA